MSSSLRLFPRFLLVLCLSTALGQNRFEDTTLIGNTTITGNVSSNATQTGGTFANTTLSGNTTLTGNVTSNATVTGGTFANITVSGTSLIAGAQGGTGVANTGKTITLGGNLTTAGAFATTLTATANTNVTLPTSGTLATQYEVAARAPSQAFVFDGTGGTTATLASTPSGNQTYHCTLDVPSSNPSATRGIFMIHGSFAAATGFGCYISTSGGLELQRFGATTGDWNAASYTAFVSSYGGQRVHLTITVSSGTLAVYVNGKAITMTETSAGTPPGWGSTLGSGAVMYGKIQTTAMYFSGYLGPLYILNYAKFPAEVLALYKTGCPEGADYNNAGQAMITGDDSTFASDTGFWSKTGATIAGGVCTLGNGHYIERSNFLQKGHQYTLGVTINSLTGHLYYYNGAAWIDEWSTTGAKTITFTAAGNGSLDIGLPTAAEIDDVTLMPLGLLLAPDATAPGLGPQLADVSGNNCPINLPGDGYTGGVTWALPSSRDAWFTYTRTSDGYVIGDRTVIPTGCYLADLWVSGDGGTVTIGESSGTPANVVAEFSPAATPAPATLLVRTTSNRKLYVDLGTAATCTVKAHIVKFP